MQFPRLARACRRAAAAPPQLALFLGKKSKSYDLCRDMGAVPKLIHSVIHLNVHSETASTLRLAIKGNIYALFCGVLAYRQIIDDI